ncbi:hypothetical protein DL95DRAFT_389612 [Leptodontidium sp. 2 PMI_412]|nr:hypothetical protein DL95DRAFT_389612 [Leptodontidium sp. 2 PMI_412]
MDEAIWVTCEVEVSTSLNSVVPIPILVPKYSSPHHKNISPTPIRDRHTHTHTHSPNFRIFRFSQNPSYSRIILSSSLTHLQIYTLQHSNPSPPLLPT